MGVLVSLGRSLLGRCWWLNGVTVLAHCLFLLFLFLFLFLIYVVSVSLPADVGGDKAGRSVGANVPPPRGSVSPAAVLGAARGGVLPEERCSDRSFAAAGDVESGGAVAYHGAGGWCCC